MYSHRFASSSAKEHRNVKTTLSFVPKMPVSQNEVNITLKTGSSVATIALLGASVHSWTEDGEERLFTSSLSSLSGPKAIRGGIPICFPCFGPPPKGNSKFDKLSQHGFARTSKWTLDQNHSGDDENGQGIYAVLGEDYHEDLEAFAEELSKS